MLDKFLNLGALTNSVAEIVKLCTANFTASDNFNLLYVGRMKGESLFYAATVSYAANLECFGDAAAVTCDNGTFKHLCTNSLSFFDSVVNSYSVSDVEFGDLFFKLLINKSVDLSVHFDQFPFLEICEAFMQSGSGPLRARLFYPHTNEIISYIFMLDKYLGNYFINKM